MNTPRQSIVTLGESALKFGQDQLKQVDPTENGKVKAFLMTIQSAINHASMISIQATASALEGSSSSLLPPMLLEDGTCLDIFITSKREGYREIL